MATTFPRAALKTLIATLANVDVSNVRWKTEPKNFVGPKGSTLNATITLGMLSRGAVGWDESRNSFDTGTGIFSTEIGGQRKATVSIRCESFDPDNPADEILEAVRTKLDDETSLRALRAVELALSDYGAVNDISYAVGNREVSAASIDLFLNANVSFTPFQPGYIEKVTHKPAPIDAGTAAGLPVVDLDDAGTYEP